PARQNAAPSAAARGPAAYPRPARPRRARVAHPGGEGSCGRPADPDRPRRAERRQAVARPDGGDAMKWLLAFLVVCLTGAAGFVLADPPAPNPSAAERLKQLRRDRALIHKLVESGLRLAEEDDPLKRADQCNRLAEDLTRAIT